MKAAKVLGCIAMAMVLCAAASAQEYALPEAEASQGWIRLFDGSTTFGWVEMGEGNDWNVENGVLTVANGPGGWLATTSQFKDFEFSARVSGDAEGSFGLAFMAPLSGHFSENGAGVVTISEPKSGKPDWHEVVVTSNDGTVVAKVDGETVDLLTDNEMGHIGILFYNKGAVRVADMRLRPINMESLFNGEDLSGWNVLPGHKSQFSVEGGALRIQDGNGQIETDGVYKDFILQLDIISNGVPEKPLNSGVFFRSPVGVFWKGYESQIRNEFKDNDRTNPHDFGTGGIYGVMNARRVIPSEKEWFHKTVVVNGNHMAVWINGYMVSDFTDTRVAVENDAKAGYVASEGTITLQGHDPTTDLSFKNIRIQEYPY